jgi:hypothetical protein
MRITNCHVLTHISFSQVLPGILWQTDAQPVAEIAGTKSMM